MIAAIVVGILLYGVAVPLLALQGVDYSYYGRPGDYLIEQIRLRTLQAFAVVWFFFLGGCIGSFLNVVIYRVPRGRTLMGNSGCPYCTQPIRFRHNVPVIGWLLLRGRCYDCHLPISPRYPIVEALVGAVFLILAVVELFSGGRSIPVRPPYEYMGVEWVVFSPKWDLIQIYAFHCAALCVLLSWALIWLDRQRVPAGYALLVFASLLAAILIAPHLAVVPWRPGFVISPFPKLEALFRTLCGIVAGLMTGGLSWASLADEDERSRLTGVGRGALCYAVAGAIVGWQGLLSIALLTPIMRWLQNALLPRRFGQGTGAWALALFGATWLHLCLWRPLASIPGWPGPASFMFAAPAYCVAAIFLTNQVAQWGPRMARPIPARSAS